MSDVCEICKGEIRGLFVGTGSGIAHMPCWEAASVQVPDGWQLVPKRMTSAMRKAFNSFACCEGEIERGYEEMLDAAPIFRQPPPFVPAPPNCKPWAVYRVAPGFVWGDVISDPPCAECGYSSGHDSECINREEGR